MDLLQIPANLAQVAGVNFSAILPELILSLFGMLILLVGVFVRTEKKGFLAIFSLIGVALALVVTIGGWGSPQEGFNGAVLQDNFAIFFKVLFLITTGMALMITDQYLERMKCNHGEIYPLILFASSGMLMMASATDMMTLFLALELMSIPLYILSGFNRENVKSNEAGLKYFLLGAFSTGFLLYGMSLVYGATGTTRMDRIAAFISQNGITLSNPWLLIGALLISVGFAFKVAAAPFHMWTPDVYEGAPTPITAYMSVGPKAAGFAALTRVFLFAFPALKGDWSSLLWVLAVLTMTVGNVTAIYQKNVKRMLAYSSIAHAGYILVGFTAANQVGTSGMMFYLFSYVFMNIGAFTILILLGRDQDEKNDLTDFTGLGFKRPLLAMLMSIFLFSLAGIPPAAGFVGKFYLFSGAIQAGYIWLAIIGVLNSAASVFFYLRVMVYMYMKKPEEEFDWMTVTPAMALCLFIAVVGVLVPGVVPGYFLELAHKALFF